MASKKPRLTDRQAAVLAAVERLRRPVMADLWQQFPDLQPSAIKKVLDSLEQKGLVASAGDQAQAYLNGVTWWTTAFTPTDDPKLATIVEAVERDLADLHSTVDPHEGGVTVFLPLVELESFLTGLPSRPVDRIRACVRQLEESGQAVRLTVSTEIVPDPEPRLAVKLEPTASWPSDG